MPTPLDMALEAIITEITKPGMPFATVPFERGGVAMPAFAAAPPSLAHYFAHFCNEHKDVQLRQLDDRIYGHRHGRRLRDAAQRFLVGR